MLLKKEESCLLLIDVQNKLTPLVLNSKSLIKKCAWMMELAQDLLVPIVMSEQYPQGLGDTVSELTMFNTHIPTFKKVHFSCYGERAFKEEYEKHVNKQQVVLIGIETHVCVLQTALEMKTSGKEVYVVVDAVSSRNEIDHQFGLKRLEREGIHLITAEMAFFEWLRAAGTTQFKELSKKYLK